MEDEARLEAIRDELRKLGFGLIVEEADAPEEDAHGRLLTHEAIAGPSSGGVWPVRAQGISRRDAAERVLSQVRGYNAGSRALGGEVPALIASMRALVREAELEEPLLAEALSRVPEDQRPAEAEKVSRYRAELAGLRETLARLERDYQ